MKSRNLAKIVTLILSCALLIGAVVGISSIAEETEKSNINIVGANVAYEGAVQVVYYVEVKDTTKTPYLLVSYDAITVSKGADINELGSKVSVKKQAGTLNVNGVDYPAFYSNGIAPKELRKDIYAVPVLVDGNNKIVEVGEAGPAAVYSPYTYAMRRFSQTTTPAQVELYKALLNYGAAVQGVLDAEASKAPDYKWADEYYIVTVNGEEANMRGNLIDTYEDYTAEAPAEGKELEGWTVNGNHVMAWGTLKISQIKPGTSVIETVYGDKNSKKETFSTADDKSFFIHGADNVTVADGVATLNTTKWTSINLKQQGDPYATAPGSKHVFETDMKVSGFISDKKDDNLAFIGFQTKIDGANESTTLQDQGQEEEITFHKGVGDHFYIAGYKIACEEWINLRYEITVAEEGVGDLVEVYVNNTCVYSSRTWNNKGVETPYATAGKAVVGFNITPRTFSSNAALAITLDNTYCYSTGETMYRTVTLDVNGGNALAETEKTFTLGTEYTLPIPTHPVLKFAGWYDGETMVNNGGLWSLNKDTTLKAKWLVAVTENFNDFSVDGKINNGQFDSATISGGVLTSSDSKTYGVSMFSVGTAGTLYGPYAAGTKYVFEADFTYVSGGKPTADLGDRQLAFVGFVNTTTQYDNHSMRYWDYLVAGTTDSGTGDSAYVTMYGQNYQKGQTYKIRYEYVVGESKIHVYTDNVYLGAVGVNEKSGIDPTNISAFALYIRKAGAKFTFDNVYCAVETEPTTVELTLGELDYGKLPDDAWTTKTLTVGDYYELPTPTLDGFTFGGWYYGDSRVADNGNWSIADDKVTLTGKWINTSVITCDDVVKSSHTSGNVLFALPHYQSGTTVADKVWATGSTVTFTTDFTYLGAKATGAGTKDSPFAATSQNVAFFSFDADKIGVKDTPRNGDDRHKYANLKWYTNNGYVNAAGELVADADGILNEGVTLAEGEAVYPKSLIFDSGIVIDYNVEYHFVFTIVMGTLTYTDGVPSSTPATVTAKATDSNGNVQTMKFANGPTYDAGANVNHLLESFSAYFRSAGTLGGISMTWKNNKFDVVEPVEEATITLNANGGVLPTGTATTINLLEGMKLPELPNPNGGAYAFLGWYNGDALVNTGDAWTLGDATLTAKWVDAATTTYADMLNVTKSAWTNDIKWTIGNYNASTVDAVGTQYIFNTKYVYQGLTGFSITDRVVTPNSGKESGTARNFGFPRFYGANNAGASTLAAGGGDTVKPSGNFVNADGVVVADAQGKLLDNYADLTADKIFYENLVWGNMTFKIGVEYDLTVTATISANGKIAVTAKAVDPDGNVDEGSIASNNAVVNVQYFYIETRGDGYTGAYSHKMSFTNTTFKKQISLDGTITVDDTKADASGNKKDPNITVPNYNVNNVDVAGQVFTIQTKYTFKGLGGVFTIDPETFKVTDCYVDNAEIAYMGFYNNNAIGDRLKYNQATLPSTAKIVNADGKVVVDENNILLEEYRDLTADDLFYSQVTWAGITFDIGVEYDLFMSYTTGATTYANGVVTAAVGTTKITATANGVTKTGTMNSGPSNDTDFLHNIQGFSFYFRGDKNMTGSADIKYTLYHSFEDIVTTLYTPDGADLGIPADATLRGVKTTGTNPTTGKAINTRFVSVVAGTAYTLPESIAIDGYTFEGWYIGETKVELTGEAWPYDKNVILTAKYVAVEAAE